MNTIIAQPPKAPADSPSWGVRIVQDIVAWVNMKFTGPLSLTGYTTANRPSATKFPRALIFDSITTYPVSSDASGNWRALQASGEPAAFTTLSITQGPVISGTYTPTLTSVANVSASTAFSCQYMRVGAVVTVSGAVAVTPTLLATLTTLGISLPVASALAATQNLAGTANSASVASASGAVLGDTSNARASLSMISVGTGSETFYFDFTYQVI